MTPKQIRKLAIDTLKQGPAEVYDKDGNPYMAYVCPLRKGMKFTVINSDADIVALMGSDESKVQFFMSEIKAVCAEIGA